MRLEVRSRTEEARPGRPPLLFVHGGFHAAWCWDVHYLPFFAGRGWPVHALSLRGHGESDGHPDIHRFTLEDYADDVRATVESIGGAAILLGHSMGGAIAERCWREDEGVLGVALLAGSPLRPAPSVVLGMLRRSPVSLLLGQLRSDPERLRRAMTPLFFSPELDATERAAHRDRLDLESPRAMSALFRRAPIHRRAGDTRPALVVAATDDVSIPLRAHEEARERLGATLLRVPGAHDLMLDPRWREGAEAIEAWLRARFD
ncbi:MAG: alpha/beta fold hydrolase [Myxococcota bacterium]